MNPFHVCFISSSHSACQYTQTCCISPQHQTTLFLLSRRRLRNLLCVLPRRVTTNTRCSGCQRPTRFIPFRTREGSVRRDLQSRAHCACCLPQRSPLNCRGFEEPAPHIFAPHQNPSSPKRRPVLEAKPSQHANRFWRCPSLQQVFTSLGNRVLHAQEACARQQAGKLVSASISARNAHRLHSCYQLLVLLCSVLEGFVLSMLSFVHFHRG
jgi:hypothetical protein